MVRNAIPGCCFVLQFKVAPSPAPNTSLYSSKPHFSTCFSLITFLFLKECNGLMASFQLSYLLYMEGVANTFIICPVIREPIPINLHIYLMTDDCYKRIKRLNQQFLLILFAGRKAYMAFQCRQWAMIELLVKKRSSSLAGNIICHRDCKTASPVQDLCTVKSIDQFIESVYILQAFCIAGIYTLVLSIAVYLKRLFRI